MTNLQQDILEAWAAKSQLDAQEELRRKAEQLPMLQQQLADQQWIEKALPVAEESERNAERILAKVTPEMKAWREKLVALYAELRQHVADLPLIQSEVALAARYTHQACDIRLEIKQRQGNAPDPMANGLHDNGAMELWEKIGGMNPDLKPLPSGAVMLQLREMMTAAAGKQVTFFQDTKFFLRRG